MSLSDLRFRVIAFRFSPATATADVMEWNDTKKCVAKDRFD
jgi:hypothetical protein